MLLGSGKGGSRGRRTSEANYRLRSHQARVAIGTMPKPQEDKGSRRSTRLIDSASALVRRIHGAREGDVLHGGGNTLKSAGRWTDGA